VNSSTQSAQNTAAAAPTPQEATLYDRLGGESKIRTIVADIVDNHLRNELVRPRFASSDRNHLIRLAAEFICMGTGGPQTYTGKDMRAAHRGLNISEQEYMAVVDDILAALDKNGVGGRERQEVLSIAYGLKAEILRL
jgi:hemoglobin